ncbi:telomeric repeat binding factor a isoform 2-T2 [Aulostomus maculatus]
MAAKENLKDLTDVESVVNRWVVDYYLSLALDLFKNNQYSEFCEIRDILASVLVRPVASTDVTATKIFVIQLLSRINEGEKLDTSFESDSTVTPLESVLMLLEKMKHKCSVHQQEFENVCTSVKEMIVRILIKNCDFDKAKVMLITHFPKPMVGKKAVFMGLISQKSRNHDAIENIDFQQFRMEMLEFCQKLCPFTVPFLHKAAKQLIDRLKEQDDESPGAYELEDCDLSSGPPAKNTHLLPCKHAIIQKNRLKAAYKALAGVSEKRTFAQLEEEVESEDMVQAQRDNLSRRLSPTPKRVSRWDLERTGLLHRDSGSPMEASPGDQQMDAIPQTQAGSVSETTSRPRDKKLYTLAQLVVEPDCQGSSHCSNSQSEVTVEEQAQLLDVSNTKDQQSPETDSEDTIHTQTTPRQATGASRRASTSLTEVPADSEEESPYFVASKDVGVSKHQNKTSPSRNCKPNLSSESTEDPHDDQPETPRWNLPRKTASNPQNQDNGSLSEICITDSSFDSSPSLLPHQRVPQSSTPHRSQGDDTGPSHSKWKQLYNNAKESKETWPDEDSFFKKNSGSPNKSPDSRLRKKWTESETQMLIKGVQKFGEGNWSKIREYYSINNRTNVNMKDRWRTMKKLKMV